MGARVNSELKKDLKGFGVHEWNQCFHCGDCTAVCAHTEEDVTFPRRPIRLLQMGLRDKLNSMTEPWLCYYCGACSEKCPRNANPGEMMMAMRRYLTSVYDWTGISGKLYRSCKAHVTAIILMFVGVLGAFFMWGGPMVTELTEAGGVQLNTFASPEVIAFLDHILLGVLSFFLVTNMLNMFYKVMIKDNSVKIPKKLYFTELWGGLFHFFTQVKLAQCERKKLYWFGHWFLMASYVTMFIFIIFYLAWFQTEDIHAWYHPQRLIGYLVTAGFLFGTVYFMIGRLRRTTEYSKFSHHSDWIFVVLLFLVALSGISIHIFRINGMPYATYYSYMLHLAFEVPMVVTFVAFSKWSHIAYTPFAIYLSNIKNKARAMQSGKITYAQAA
jgi:ferredoxin